MPENDSLSLVRELMGRRGELSPEQGELVDELAKRFISTGELRPGPPRAPLPAGLQGGPAPNPGLGPKGAMAQGLDVQPGRGVLDIPPVAGARQVYQGIQN